MALVRALSKAATVAKRTNGMMHGMSIVDIFDLAMDEALDAMQAKKKEQEKEEKEIIPLHVGSATDAKAMSLAKVARISRATKLAAAGGKKRAWGKLAVSVAMGGASSTEPPPIVPVINPRIQFDNLLEKEDLEKQELRGAASPAASLPAGQSITRLEKRVEETQAQSKARDEAILERIASLEIALTTCVASIANVVESQQATAKKRTPTMVRMRRSKLQRAETTPLVGAGSATLLTEAELERRELMEAERANGGLAPSLSRPFADMGLDA